METRKPKTEHVEISRSICIRPATTGRWIGHHTNRLHRTAKRKRQIVRRNALHHRQHGKHLVWIQFPGVLLNCINSTPWNLSRCIDGCSLANCSLTEIRKSLLIHPLYPAQSVFIGVLINRKLNVSEIALTPPSPTVIFHALTDSPCPPELNQRKALNPEHYSALSVLNLAGGRVCTQNGTWLSIDPMLYSKQETFSPNIGFLGN